MQVWGKPAQRSRRMRMQDVFMCSAVMRRAADQGMPAAKCLHARLCRDAALHLTGALPAKA